MLNCIDPGDPAATACGTAATVKATTHHPTRRTMKTTDSRKPAAGSRRGDVGIAHSLTRIDEPPGIVSRTSKACAGKCRIGSNYDSSQNRADKAHRRASCVFLHRGGVGGHAEVAESA